MTDYSKQGGRSLRLAAIFGALAVLALAVTRCGGRGEYIGTFDLSHYCLEVWNGDHMCGNSAYGCGGDRLVPGKSLAVPAGVLEKYPVGTKVVLVYPNGREERLIIHDTGRALEELGRLDMPVYSHSEALELGVIEGVKLYTEK